MSPMMIMRLSNRPLLPHRLTLQSTSSQFDHGVKEFLKLHQFVAKLLSHDLTCSCAVFLERIQDMHFFQSTQPQQVLRQRIRRHTKKRRLEVPSFSEIPPICGDLELFL